MCKTLITAFALTFLLNLNVVVADSTSTASPKSRGKALAYSLRATAIPAVVGGLMALEGMSDNYGWMTGFGLGLGSAGVIFGPGAGHVYARRTGRFWGGAAIRGLAGSLAVVGGFWIYFSSNFHFGSSPESHGSPTGGIVLVAGAGAIALTSIAYDIASVGKSVDRYNRSRGIAKVNLELCYIANYKAPGLALRLSF